MKRILLLVLLSLGVGTAVSAPTDSVRGARLEHRAVVREEVLAFPRSRIGVAVRFTGLGGLKGASGPGYTQTPRMPYVGVEYSYRVWDFLEVAISLSYAYSRLDYSATGEVSRSWIGHSFLPAIDARYAWFNSRWVSFYSSLGLGMPIAHSIALASDRPSSAYSSEFQAFCELTPLGIRVGRRLFGYVEPCRLAFTRYSPEVQIRIGLGYTF